jgi:hypothetical protein
MQEPLPPQAPLDFTRFLTTTYPWRDYLQTAITLGGFEALDQATQATATQPATAPAAIAPGATTPPATTPPATTPGATTESSLQRGARARFQTLDGPRQAELLAISAQGYLWVEVGLDLDQAALQETAVRLDAYYQQLSELFGQEQRPGIDGDPRIHVLHYLGAADLFELGYFDETNQYPQDLFSTSNEREMVYLNMSRLEVGSDLYYGTLVHELQHLIQWNLDRNEDVWLNEGLSQLAEKLAGLNTVQTDAYLQRPGTRLDRWTTEEPEVYAHYAASYLFTAYLWEQLGERALRELARHPANGLAAVRVVLAGYRPATSLEAFSSAWAVATYLDDPAAGPDYHYRTLELQPPFLDTRVRRLPFETVATAAQYGVHYIDLDFEGPATIRFAGATLAGLTTMPPAGEAPIWFAPGTNNSHATLSAEIDLTNSPAAALEFDAWYELEEDWDFAYLSASADGGQSWSLLYPTHAVSGEFGPAFGGSSAEGGGQRDGWVAESISLERFAGRPLRLRFELLTDSDNPSRGFAIANLGVSGLNTPSPRWQAAGFVATGWQLPQKWSVQLIQEGSPPAVIPLALDSLNRAQLPVTLGPEGGVLVVMAQTPLVEGTAAYWLAIE